MQTKKKAAPSQSSPFKNQRPDYTTTERQPSAPADVQIIYMDAPPPADAAWQNGMANASHSYRRKGNYYAPATARQLRRAEKKAAKKLARKGVLHD